MNTAKINTWCYAGMATLLVGNDAPDSEAVSSSPSDLTSPSALLSLLSSSDPLFHHHQLGNLRNYHLEYDML